MKIFYGSFCLNFGVLISSCSSVTVVQPSLRSSRHSFPSLTVFPEYSLEKERQRLKKTWSKITECLTSQGSLWAERQSFLCPLCLIDTKILVQNTRLPIMQIRKEITCTSLIIKSRRDVGPWNWADGPVVFFRNNPKHQDNKGKEEVFSVCAS